MITYTQRGSALYLVCNRMTISTHIHLLRPVFTVQGYTGLKVKNILSCFLQATKWNKSSRMCPVPVARIFYFQDGGDVTNPVFLSLCILPRKCKSRLMPVSQAKNWQQDSANPALFPRMSPGSISPHPPWDGR